MKNLFIIALALVLIGVYLILFPQFKSENDTQLNSEKTIESTQEENNNEFCIQVITSAKNPDTGAIVEFPTPCDVPDGWTQVEPEGLDLEVI